MSVFSELKRKEKVVKIDGVSKDITVVEAPYRVRKQVDDLQSKKESGKARTLLLINTIYCEGEQVFKSEKDIDDVPASHLENLFNIAMLLTFSESNGDEIDVLKKS